MKPLGWLILFLIIALVVTWFCAIGYSIEDVKPLGWLILFLIIALIVTWFTALGYSRGKRPVDGFTKLSISLLSVVIGILSGFLLLIPCLFIMLLILPNKPHNGHYGMPMGQYFIGIGLSVILGFSIAIISYFMILKWRTGKPT